ncbi:uncharacterized protein [Ptychodera flava]|uniref:uncharacterized protein n=1 Tax=Ptychodera flava TaxID=63121 RepID=UPI00396A9776
MQVNSNVTNISSCQLTPAQSSVLSKGLMFCPKPEKVNTKELINDVREFKRKCRLRYMYRDKENNQTTSHLSPGPFKREKSYYNPPPNENQTLEAFLNAVEDEVLNSQNWKKTYDNISKDERIALQQLTNREDLTIKAADKGGGIVVMDTSWYIDKCNDHLQNQSFYKELDHDPTDLYIGELENKVRKWEKNKWISRDIASKLIPKEPKPGHFYGLPKIHKENTPLRPIIPQCQALTSPLAAYVDHVLQPIVQSLPSYLKDTTHHLIDSHDIIVPDNSILVTMDVISLYTNIPHDYGIQAVREALADNNVSPSNQQLITEMLEFILTRNYFQFDGKYFLQVQGTAMGSKVAPSYANITMGKLEKQILANCPTKPMQWRRFIDDIRFIWLKTLQELLQFHEYCNSIHPSLKFTIEYSDTEISFLDTKMMMRENKIHTTVYSKPTDKHSYLLPSSCHPRHIFKSIPQGQALRYRRICSSTDLYNKEVENLHRHLTDRNYKQSSIVTAITKQEIIPGKNSLTTQKINTLTSLQGFHLC